MQTLIVVSKSTPIAVFHFIISNYLRWIEDPVQRTATTKTFAFMLFQGQKSRFRYNYMYPREAMGDCPRGAIDVGGNCPWGQLSGGNCPLEE